LLLVLAQELQLLPPGLQMVEELRRLLELECQEL